jgi:hypothetical protein
MSASRSEIMQKTKTLLSEMYGETRWGERALYHGTSMTALHEIHADGIKPRGNGRGNWHGTIKSNPEAVYLTNAYPLFFAQQACGEGKRHVILEVNIEKIQFRLQADEDAVEQTMRGMTSSRSTGTSSAAPPTTATAPTSTGRKRRLRCSVPAGIVGGSPRSTSSA